MIDASFSRQKYQEESAADIPAPVATPVSSPKSRH
jgi:hypothetical protein